MLPFIIHLIAAFVFGTALDPTDPASAIEAASAANTRAAPDTPASSAPFCVPARTPLPLPADSAPHATIAIDSAATAREIHALLCRL